jgi:hypothetical protein
MKCFFAAVLFVALSLSASAADSKIARLMARLSKDPMWISGAFPLLELPRSASTVQVVARCLDMTGFDAGHIKRYQIRAVEKLPWGDEPAGLTAVRITSNLGDKIIVMHYERGSTGWWTKVFSAK